MHRSPSRTLLAVPNVTAHPSTSTVPMTALLYNGPLLCSFNSFAADFLAPSAGFLGVKI